MIKSLQFKNFKCFKDISLENFARINVVVGESMAGKTALLEGLFICGGPSADIHFRTSFWRLGLSGEMFQVQISSEFPVRPWRDLFYNLDASLVIYMQFNDSDSGRWSVKIQTKKQDDQALLPATADAYPTEEAEMTLSFIGEDHGKITEEKFEMSSAEKRVSSPLRYHTRAYAISFLTQQTIFNAEEIAKRYSGLVQEGKEEGILKAVQSIFPHVEKLSVQVPHTLAKVALYAKLSGITGQIPVNYISGGLTKFLSILIHIASKPNGVVLIDEIENGLYYKNIPDILRAAVALCQENNSQLFFSTHSYECLQGVASVMKDSPDSFGLLRVYRKDKESKASNIQGTSAIAAIEEGLELRG